MKVLYILLLWSSIFSASAQNSLQEILRQQLVQDWERAKAYTQEYLDAMPADKYNVRPVDSVRTFAGQMLHLTKANVALATFATGAQNKSVQNIFFKRTFEESPTAQTKDSVVYYVNMSYDFVINAIKNADFSKLNENVSTDMLRVPRSATRLAWLLKAFEHQTHHRGQCTVYLRVAGIHPPNEKLF